MLVEALLQELLVHVLVHAAHCAPKTGEEGTSLLELHGGILSQKLLEACPEPLDDVQVWAAFVRPL